MQYGFFITLDDGFDQAVAKVTEALQQQGFGVLTEIDIKATMKAKLNIDQLPYKILGACNPSLAHQALEAEPDIGLLLPCNVVVREDKNGKVTVGFMDPQAVLTLVDKEGIKELAQEVRSRLEVVRDSLK
ncbi:MAG: DUF302 domain-containing protein [Arenicellales bacterium]